MEKKRKISGTAIGAIAFMVLFVIGCCFTGSILAAKGTLWALLPTGLITEPTVRQLK